MSGVLSLHLTLAEVDAQTVADRFVPASSRGPTDVLLRIARELEAVAAGGTNGKITVRVDASSPVAGTGTIVVTGASCTAGDKIIIIVPQTSATYVLVCVATDAEVTASPGTGLWSIQTNSNTAVGASIAAAINALEGLRREISAVNSSGTVTLTALHGGSLNNSIVINKKVVTGGSLTITQFSGGFDEGARATATVTIDFSKQTDGDTLQIGGQVFTWKTSASTTSQIGIGGSSAVSVTNAVAKINAHATTGKLITAAVGTSSNILSLTAETDPRVGEMMALIKVESQNNSMVLSGAAFSSGSSDASQGTPVTYILGAA